MRKLIELIGVWFKYLKFRYFGKEIVVKNSFLGERLFACKNNVEYYRVNNYGDEEMALGAFMFLLREDDIVWDIGASVGLFSIYSAPLVSKVISFEPDREIYERLLKNIALNRFEDKINALQIGLSTEAGLVSLSSDGLNGNSPSISNLGRHQGQIMVEVNSIDNLIKSGLHWPSVLKIDIEGAEILALKGAQDLLKSNAAPRLIFIEIHPDFLIYFESHESEVLDLITSNNYLIVCNNIRENQRHVIAIKN
ncbi:fkbM_fam, methyltransferase, FkbM family [Spirosomataceae bacterium]